MDQLFRQATDEEKQLVMQNESIVLDDLGIKQVLYYYLPILIRSYINYKHPLRRTAGEPTRFAQGCVKFGTYKTQPVFPHIRR